MDLYPSNNTLSSFGPALCSLLRKSTIVLERTFRFTFPGRKNLYLCICLPTVLPRTVTRLTQQKNTTLFYNGHHEVAPLKSSCEQQAQLPLREVHRSTAISTHWGIRVGIRFSFLSAAWRHLLTGHHSLRFYSQGIASSP
uniref:Uncharacterized protein n=1 Tax=Anser cygnoides TaxID=8845 RepID=A0A8B9DEQ1_ANSCY